MTRPIPTRDRAQATRYQSKEHAYVVREHLWKQCGRDLLLTGLERTGEQWLITVPAPSNCDFWFGPWYVREVVE